MKRTLLIAAAAAALATLVPLTGPSPAQAACSTNSGKGISGTVYGLDGRDVNVSIGIDLVDRNGRPVNAVVGSAGYGCRKTTAYSVPQTYLNHFVGPEGAPRASLMKDGTRTRRTWRVPSIPKNAVGAYVEVYSRGYTGSPCRDANGNYCFNKPNTTKYGYANKHLVPVGTNGVTIKLPMSCGYRGTSGSIQGRLLDSAGRPVSVRNVYAWTEHKWNAAPYVHGWGSAALKPGYYVISNLAPRQEYVVWVQTTDGRSIKRSGVPVSDCRSTPLTFGRI